MSNRLKILVGIIQVIKDITQDDVAKAINYSRKRLGTLINTGDKKLERLLIKEYGNDLHDFFGTVDQLMEPEAEYGAVKIVDADELLVRDTLQNKIMLREILRNQAKLLAAQEIRAVSEVLDEMNESLRAESEDEFDAL